MSEDTKYDPNAADQLTKERGKCIQGDCHVKKFLAILKECEKRVTGKSYTAETCQEESIDFMEALDHCAAEKAFARIV